MISSAISYIVYGFVFLATYPLRLLSDVTIPAALTTAIQQIGALIIGIDGYWPVGTTLIVLGLVLVVEKYTALYKAAMWLIKRFPTQS